MKRNSIQLFACLLTLAVMVGGSTPSRAGVISKVAIKGAKEALKTAVEKAAKEAMEKAVQSSTRRAVKRFGDDGLSALQLAAKKSGKSVDEVLDLASRRSSDFKRLLQTGDEEALQMVARNGDAGLFMFKRFYGQSDFRKGSQWFRPESDEAIQEAWKLVAPGRIDGSWVRLRESLTRAGVSGVERDFAETLFLNRVKAGGINGLSKSSKYLDGHVGGKRQGIDFIEVDQSGRVHIIEFGTGKKPSVNNPLQMTDDRIRMQWNEFVANSNKDQLRGLGINNQLLNPNFVNSPDFRVADHFGKKICAPDINLVQASKLGCEPIFLR